MTKKNFSRILRAFTAMVLALLVMFGAMATTIAAVVENLTDTGVSSFTRPGGQAIYLNCFTNWGNNTNGYEPQIHLYTDGSWNGRYDLKGDDIKMISGSNYTWFYAYIPDNNTTYTHVAVSRGDNDNWSGIVALPSNAYENTIYIQDNTWTTISSIGACTYSVDSGHANLYFDNTNTDWDNVYFYIGRTTDYLNVYPMEIVDNTDGKMYYLGANSSWNNYRVFGFCTGSFTSGQNFSSFNSLATASTKYTTPYSAYDISGANKIFLGYGNGTADVSSLQIKWIEDNGFNGNTSNNTVSTYINMPQTVISSWGGVTSITGYEYSNLGVSGVTALANPVEVKNTTGSANLGRHTIATVNVAPYNGFTAAATVDGVAQTITNNQFTYDVGDAAHTVNVTYTATGHPDVMLLGLWTESAQAATAWSENTTNNSDRVMAYMDSGTYAGKYYLELTLPYNTTFTKTGSGGYGNGFKVFDYTDNKWYGNSGMMTATSTWTFSNSTNDNCELKTISTEGNHTYKFVYNPTNHQVSVYYPQIVTYNNNESTAVSGGATSADTTSQLVVAYGDKAKNITPVREGYAFGGWYDDKACTI